MNQPIERFHSIGIPSEWGQKDFDPLNIRSSGFPFNWDPQRVGTRHQDGVA